MEYRESKYKFLHTSITDKMDRKKEVLFMKHTPIDGDDIGINALQNTKRDTLN